MTQAQLAQQVGVTTPFLNELINGHHCDVKVSLVVAVHKASGIPIDRLIAYFVACSELAKRQARDE